MDMCEHREREQEGHWWVYPDFGLVLGDVVIRSKEVRDVPYNTHKHYTFPVPRGKRVDKVLESYKLSLSPEHGEEFLEEFRRDNGKKCAKKKKLVLAKYKICCRHGLPVDLGEEVKKLGGGARISVRDLA